MIIYTGIIILVIALYRMYTDCGSFYIVTGPDGRAKEMILNDEKAKAINIIICQKKVSWEALLEQGYRCKKVRLSG